MMRRRSRRSVHKSFLFFLFIVSGLFLLSFFILDSFSFNELFSPDSSLDSNIPLASSTLLIEGKQDVSATSSFTSDFRLSAPSVKQGGVFSISVSSSVSRLEFLGQQVAPFVYQGGKRVVFGVPTTLKPGRYPLVIWFPSSTNIKEYITVVATRFSLVDLPIPPETGLTEEKVSKGLSENKEKIEKIIATSPEAVLFQDSFGLPLRDNSLVSSPFGEIRRMGASAIRHLGIDFAGRRGAYVSAMNDGIVRAAYSDLVYGNSIIVDHGVSIVSMYLHLDTMSVKMGDRVNKGQVIGTLGSTGYSTAPHLHLSVKVGSVSVDPMRFIDVWK